MSDFEAFNERCQELGLPEDTRMDDILEFLDAFCGDIRDRITTATRIEMQYDHDNPRGTGPRDPDPDSEEGQQIIDAAVREELRNCAEKLARLTRGLK